MGRRSHSCSQERRLLAVGLALACVACTDPHPEGRHTSIHVSTDGGLVWRTVGGPFKGDFVLALCVAEANALAVSRNAELLKLSPRGWHRLAMRRGHSTALFAVWCEGAHVVAGGDQPALQSSHDRGRTWAAVPVDLDPGSWIRAIRRIGRSVIAVGDFGALLRSDDDGRSWSGRNCSPSSVHVPHVAFRDLWGSSPDDLLLIGWRAGGPLPPAPVMLRTRDGGRTLTPIAAGTDRRLEAICGDGRGTVIAVGSGAIVRSTDGGASFAPVTIRGEPLLNTVWGDGRGIVVVGGERGTILRSVDNGKSFVGVTVDTPHHLDAIAGHGSTLFALGHHPDPPGPIRILSH